MASIARRVLRALGSAVARQTGSTKVRPTRSRPAPSRRRRRRGAADDYPGDFTGIPTIVYAPNDDDHPDPGEIVWTWVPYEDDVHEGKDRPVLIIGWDKPWLLGLMLTSKDHHRDAADEARHGRYWMDLGAGDWDSQKRPSEVRLDRIIRVDPQKVRREGARLNPRLFREVAGAAKETNGW